MSSSALSSFATFFAQAANAASGAAASPAAADPATQQGPPAWTTMIYMFLIGGVVYFALIRPQTMAKKKQEETVKSAKTGDRVVTTGGIVGIITNVKDTSVIMRTADTKIEVEKTHIDKITRPDSSADTEKAVAKAS